MRIPEVAKHMVAIARELRVLARQLKRRPPIKRAPNRSARFTKALAARIRRYVRRYPTMSNAAIGRHFNVDGGRVTDAMRGKRK
jgi:hypothetical protein